MAPPKQRALQSHGIHERGEVGGNPHQEGEGGAPPKQECTPFMSVLIQDMGEAPKTFRDLTPPDEAVCKGQENRDGNWQESERSHLPH